MTNEQLAIRIKAGENVEENMELLYEQTKNFIRSIAWQYRAHEELEDLLQEGALALYDAVEGYEPQGNTFLSYAAYHIKGHIIRYIEDKSCCLRIPIHRREQIRKYKKFVTTYTAEHGYAPSDWEIGRYMWLTLDQVGELKRSAGMVRLGSLDSPVTGSDGGEDQTVGDFVSSDTDLEETILDQVQQDQLKAVLWDCVDGLPEEQAEAIRARYQDGLTLKETGERLGTTSEGARQQEAKALRRLRSGSNMRRLRPFFPEHDRIYSMSIAAVGLGHFERTWTSSTEYAALRLAENGDMAAGRTQDEHR